MAGGGGGGRNSFVCREIPRHNNRDNTTEQKCQRVEKHPVILYVGGQSARQYDTIVLSLGTCQLPIYVTIDESKVGSCCRETGVCPNDLKDECQCNNRSLLSKKPAGYFASIIIL